MRRGVEWWLGLRWLDRRLLMRSLPLWYGRLALGIAFAGLLWLAGAAIVGLTLFDYRMAGPEDDPAILSADTAYETLLTLGMILLAFWLLMILLRERQDTAFGRLNEVRAWYLLGGALLFLAPAFIAPAILSFAYAGFDRGVDPAAPIELRMAIVENAHADLAELQRGLEAIRETLLMGSADYPESAFEGDGSDGMNMYGSVLAVETEADYITKFIKAESEREAYYLGLFPAGAIEALSIAGTSAYRIDSVALTVSRELAYLMATRAWIAEIALRMPESEASLALFAGQSPALVIKSAIQARLGEIDGQLAAIDALLGNRLQLPAPELDRKPPESTFDYSELPQSTKDFFAAVYQRFASLPLADKKSLLQAIVGPVQALHALGSDPSEAKYFAAGSANKTLPTEIKTHADAADQILRAMRLFHSQPAAAIAGDDSDAGFRNYDTTLPRWVRPYLPVFLLILIAPAVILVHVARRMGLMVLLWVAGLGVVFGYVVGGGLSLGVGGAQAVLLRELANVTVVWSAESAAGTMMVQAIWILPLLACVALFVLATWRRRASRRIRKWTMLALLATALGTGVALGTRVPLITVDPAKASRSTQGGQATPLEAAIASLGGNQAFFEFIGSDRDRTSATPLVYGLGLALLLWAVLWDLIWAAMRRVLSLPE